MGHDPKQEVNKAVYKQLVYKLPCDDRSHTDPSGGQCLGSGAGCPTSGAGAGAGAGVAAGVAGGSVMGAAVGATPSAATNRNTRSRLRCMLHETPQPSSRN